MIDSKFVNFIKEHHVLTLATSIDNQPYCCSCFYAYDEENNVFVVKINENTRHGQETLKNNKVSAAIALETEEIGKIQGLQLTAEAIYYDGDQLKQAKTTYLQKFPYAIAAPGDYLVLKPNFMKLTDNRFGFGKKLIWNN